MVLCDCRIVQALPAGLCGSLEKSVAIGTVVIGSLAPTAQKEGRKCAKTLTFLRQAFGTKTERTIPIKVRRGLD